MNSFVCKFILASSTLMIAMACVPAPRAPQPIPDVRLAGHTFREVKSLGELPQALQKVLGLGREGLGGIADRDQRYNATDAVEPGLPMHRLVTAGIDGDFALVEIEHGGFISRTDATLYSGIHGKPKVEKTWKVSGGARTLRDLVTGLS